MGQPRIDLQLLLEGLLGTRNVYFQQPPNTGMKYPCIIYEWDDESVTYADNKRHRADKRYTVTSISRDPLSDIPDKIAALTYASFNRAFQSDDLNHVVYTLYF